MTVPTAFCVPFNPALRSHPVSFSAQKWPRRFHAHVRKSATMAAATPPQPSKRLLDYLSRAEEGNPSLTLARAEAAFTAMKARQKAPAKFPNLVHSTPDRLLGATETADFDVLIAGGTLGSLYATALQARGWRVAVVERGAIQGRRQEWNISRVELASLVSSAVLSQAQLDAAIVTECAEPGRLAFASREQGLRTMHVPDVLNVGVAPDALIASAVRNLESAGGIALQGHCLTDVLVGPDAIRVSMRRTTAPPMSGALGAGGTGLAREGDGDDEMVSVTTRLLIDAMGSFSPIAEQSREARAPDGVCITVGSCMTADWPTELHTPDIMVSQAPIDAHRSAQYFWEAFPVGRDPTARTTYMFAYGACDPARQTLTETLEDYIVKIEQYQGVPVEDVNTVKRILFGFFPSYYRTCPTDVAFDRVLPVGDAGGLQSPISFGGFGCCVRHLPRICNAVDEALREDQRQGSNSRLLKKDCLQLVQWYLPSLSVTGLFHKAMGVPPGATTAGAFLDEYGINDVLWNNMKAMEAAGRETQMTFLRDVVTAGGLTKTLARMAVKSPGLAARLSVFIGPTELLDWLRHYIALVGYAVALPFVVAVRDWMVSKDLVTGETKFWLNRMADGLTYGSGADALND